MAIRNPAEALASFEKALEIDRENPLSWTYRGLALERLGRKRRRPPSPTGRHSKKMPRNKAALTNQGMGIPRGERGSTRPSRTSRRSWQRILMTRRPGSGRLPVLDGTGEGGGGSQGL